MTPQPVAATVDWTALAVCQSAPLPYTIIVYPIVFLIMSKLWAVPHRHGYVTAGDVVHGRYGSRGLELAVAATWVLAVMPSIALQLVGMAAARARRSIAYTVEARLSGRHFILFLLDLAGDRVDAPEPAMQIDIGTAFRTKGAVFFCLRLRVANDAKRRSRLAVSRAIVFVHHLRGNRLPRD